MLLGGFPAVGQGSKAEVIIWMQRGVPALWEEQEQLSGLLGLPWESGRLGRQTQCHLGSGGEVKANTAPASSILFSLLPGDFRAPQTRCQGPWRHALATSTYLAHVVPMTGILQARQHVGSVWRAQDTEGAVVGVKPNKPNATDYQQPLTAQEAPRKPPTNTVGTRRDSHRKSLTQFTAMELQI